MPKEGDGSVRSALSRREPLSPEEQSKHWRGMEYLKIGNPSFEKVANKIQDICVPYAEDELLRLYMLHSSHFLDRDPDLEKQLLVYSSLVSKIFKAPIAYASFVDVDKQQLLARVNLDDHDFNWRDESVCTYTILQEYPDVFTITDMSVDPRFNQLGLYQLGIRFYCGTALRLDGHKIGTICVMDFYARQPTLVEKSMMLDIGVAASAMLQERRKFDAYREDRIMQRLERQMHTMRTPLQSMMLAAAAREDLDKEITDGISEINLVVERSSLLCKVLMQRLQGPLGEPTSFPRVLAQLKSAFPSTSGVVRLRFAKGLAELPDVSSFETIMSFIILTATRTASESWAKIIVAISISQQGCPDLPGINSNIVRCRLFESDPEKQQYYINVKITTRSPVAQDVNALSLSMSDYDDFQSVFSLTRELGGKIFSVCPDGGREASHTLSFPAIFPSHVSPTDFVALQMEAWEVDDDDGMGSGDKKEDTAKDNQGATPAPISPVSPELGELLPLRVLLVEDSISVQKMMSMFLRKKGCVVDIAANGKEGLVLLSSPPEGVKYHVAFVDYLMPVMLGNDMMAAVKAEMKKSADYPSYNTLYVGMSATGSGHEFVNEDTAQNIFCEKPVPPRTIEAILSALRGGDNVEAIVAELASRLQIKSTGAEALVHTEVKAKPVDGEKVSSPSTFLKPSKVHPE